MYKCSQKYSVLIHCTNVLNDKVSNSELLSDELNDSLELLFATRSLAMRVNKVCLSHFVYRHNESLFTCFCIVLVYCTRTVKFNQRALPRFGSNWGKFSNFFSFGEEGSTNFNKTTPAGPSPPHPTSRPPSLFTIFLNKRLFPRFLH